MTGALIDFDSDNLNRIGPKLDSAEHDSVRARTMNDPHVVALIYRIHHGDHVDYKNAGSRMIDYQHFSVEVGGESARVSLKSHFSSREDARQAVEPALRAWELHQALEYGPQTIEFIYERSEIVDRAPTPGQHSLIAEPLHFKVEFGRPTLTLNFAAFPVPAQNLARDVVVDHMFERYCLYKQGETLLAEAANFCLTCLEHTFHPENERRKKVARVYCIDKYVLGEIARLASRKGGREARKGEGVAEEFTDTEKYWLEAAMKALIRRAAEVAFDHEKVVTQITMNDLPSLS